MGLGGGGGAAASSHVGKAAAARLLWLQMNVALGREECLVFLHVGLGVLVVRGKGVVQIRLCWECFVPGTKRMDTYIRC